MTNRHTIRILSGALIFFLLGTVNSYSQNSDINFRSEVNSIFSNFDGDDPYSLEDVYDEADHLLDDVEDSDGPNKKSNLEKAEWIEDFASILNNDGRHIDMLGIQFLDNYLSINRSLIQENECFDVEIWEVEYEVLMLAVVSKLKETVVRFEVKYSSDGNIYTISNGGVGGFSEEAHVIESFSNNFEDDFTFYSAKCVSQLDVSNNFQY